MNSTTGPADDDGGAAGGVGPAGPDAGAGPASAVPAGTILRTGQYLTDLDGRVVVPRGLSIPAGVVPTADELDRWIGFGFTALAVEVPMTSSGRFPAVGDDPPTAADGADAGLERAATLTSMLTDRGFRVVLRTVPAATPSGTLSATALTQGLPRLAERFRDVGGLIGYEVAATTGSTDLNAAVRASDPRHLLWRAQPAPFDPAATVAVNDPTGYLTGWGDGSVEKVRSLADAADAFGLGWFYPGDLAEDADSGDGVDDADGAADGDAVAPPPSDTVRPYPAAVAGMPQPFTRAADGTFTFSYLTEPVGGAAFEPGTPTAIVLPVWTFPTGYEARADGAEITSRPGAAVLCLVARPDAALVRVEVVPTATGSVTVPTVAGAASCPAGVVPAGPDDAESPADAAPDAAQDGGILFWALPLLGATGMAALLGPVFLRLRRRPD